MRLIGPAWKPCLLLLQLFFLPLSQAHEFWIEPLGYQLQTDAPIRANLKVGQHFKGDSFPYIPANTQSFDLRIGNETRFAGARVGDMPAARVVPFTTGLAILSHVTSTFVLEYGEPGKFEAFLEAEGLSQVLAEHLAAGSPSVGVKEAYQRFAKSLIQVGDAGGNDQLLGFDFEWLLETNPYIPGTQPFRARLYWQGRPLQGVHARLFARYHGDVVEERLTTDRQGRVQFRVKPGSEILLNAVQMTRPSAELRSSRGISWKSYWASITFGVPASR